MKGKRRIFSSALAFVLAITIFLLPLQTFAWDDSEIETDPTESRTETAAQEELPEPTEPTASEETEAQEEPTEPTEPGQDASAQKELPLREGAGSLFEGEGTEAQPYLIQSADDWNALSESINSGGTAYSGKYFKLTQTISVSTVLGNRPDNSTDSNDNVFSGTFDGGGYTLNVNINESGFGAAPFAFAHNATIKNLHVTGTVTSGANHATGLVAASKGRSIYDASSLTIQNVTVSVNVSCNSHVAGIVGHAHSANITMENVVFDGSMSASSVQGGMIGWGGLGNGATYSAAFRNCMFAGTYRSGVAFYPVAFANGQGTATLLNDFYTTSFGSGGSPIPNSGDGQLKLLAASVEQGGSVRYFDSVNTAADSSNWVAGSTLKLMTDVTTSSTINVPTGEHTLDLNGHALRASAAGYSVVTVGSGAELTVDDLSGNTGRITGGSVGQNYGGGVTVDGGTFTLRGGAISGNANTYGGIGNCGGGIHVRNGAQFYMEGGEISGNTSYVGGGVCTDASATTVSITGGVIKNNRTDRFGSAIWAGRNAAAIFRIGGSAEIVDNISTWTADKDGEGTLNTGYTYLLSGDPTVHGDWKTNGTSSPNTHINLDNTGSSVQPIELEGALTNSTGTPKLTVTPLYRWNDLANGQTFVFTKNWSVYMGAAHPADYFKVDDGVTGVRVIRKNGEAAFTGGSDLGDLYIFFDGNGGEGAMDPQLATGAALNPNAFTREGFGFAGWNTKADGSGTPYADEGIVNPSGDVKLYAQWKEYAASVISGDTSTSYAAFSDAVNAWTAGSTLKLLTDVATSSTINVPTGEHTFDLNGYGILMTGNDRVITINQGASLELNDSDPDRIHYITLTNYRGTAVSDSGEESVSNGNGVIKVTGGYLTGGYRNNSGSHDRCGAGVFNWGTFVMNGGSIVGNTLYNNSGGAIRNSGYFTMNGGTIAFNYASGNGGGVTTYVPGGSQGKMTMNGGEISDNYCGSYGGGIQIAGPIEMTGGSVVRNTAGAGGSGVFYDGKNDRFKLSGNPVIKDNSNNDDLYLGANATFMINGSLNEEADIHVLMNTPAEFTVGWKNIMGDADPAKYFTSDNSSYSVFLNNNGEAEIGTPPVASIIIGETATSYAAFSDAVNAWTAGSTLKLMTDVATSSTIVVPSGEHTLDLNGHGIKMTGSGGVIKIPSNADLTLIDSRATDTTHYYYIDSSTNLAVLASSQETAQSSNADKNGSFTGGYITGGNNPSGNDEGGGGILVLGKLTMNNGTVIGNYVAGAGGGINVCNGGNASITSTNIIGNNTGNVGGGVDIPNYGTTVATLDHCVIRHNHANSNTAGIAARGGSVTLKDCDVFDNNAQNNTAGMVAQNCHLTLDSVNIKGNTTVNSSNGYAPGITIRNSNYTNFSFTVKGTVTVENNTMAGNADDSVYLHNGRNIIVGGTLTNTVPIKIRLQNGSGEFTSGWKANMGDADPAKYFTSDNSSYSVFLNNNGEAEIGAPPVASIIIGETSTDYSAFSDAVNAWLNASDGATLKLLDDVSYTDKIILTNGITRILDLNGKTFTRTVPSGDGTVFDVNSGANFTLTDTSEEQTGVVTRQSGNYGGTVLFVRDSGSVINFNGGTLTGFTSRVVITWQGSTVNMSGGEISGNNLNNGDATDGIVRTYSRTSEPGGTFNMTGGRIVNNTLGSGKTGGAVYVGNNGTFRLSGDAEISGNTQNGSARNVYLPTGATIALTGAMADGASVGITLQSGSGEFTSGWKDNMGGADPAKYFTSDDADYEVRPENGEAILSYPLVSGVSAEGFSGDYDGKAHSITVTVPNGATVKYGTTEGDYSLTECPAYTDAGTYTVYYQATQDKHLPVAGSATVQIDTINATVTVTGKAALTDYDGELHTVSGYDAVASTPLYDVTKDFTFSGKAEAVRANAGTAYMGLAPEQFANTNRNFAEVTFDVTDGYVTVKPINVTVTITGHNAVVDYDGQTHSVSGYDVQIGNALYKESYFSFSGDATATRTEKGKTEMGLSAEQFTNNNSNFATVTFDVTDGYIMIAPIDVTVTIVGNHDTVDYDGTEHAVSGYTATADVDLYDVNSDFVFNGSAAASQTDAGTAKMGLKAEQFTNTNENFAVVVFMVTDGYVTVDPIDTEVTVTGHTAAADYDGEAHSVSGYDAVASTPLYDVTKDVAFIGSASATQINAGTANMGLSAEQFSNTNANFATVTFNVTDGFMTVNPIDVTVTITGHTATADYDGKAHTVTGYDVISGSALYSASDFTFSGKAEATRVDAGTTKMGLAPEQFANTNPNFATATFRVIDGYIKINTVDAVITTAPVSTGPIYDGAWKELVMPGKAEGGTLYYALGDDPRNAPAADSFDTVIPSAKEIGSYYVWYKVEADSNHNDLSPAYVKVTLADAAWLTLTGTLYQSDGVTPLADAVVSLMDGDQPVDYVITDSSGNYQFIVPAGVYNVLVESGTSSSTTIAEIFEDGVLNISVSEGKTESLVMLNGNGSTDFGIAVGGLAEEAAAIRANSGIGADDEVSLVMTVELKTNNTAKNGADFSYLLQTKSFMFFDITLTQTIGIETTVMDATANVLEIAVPYEKTGRQDLMVYSSDGTGVRYFRQSDSKEAGTFRIDKANGYIFIYADRFATFAIGYTPHYRLNSTMTLGSFEGNVNVVITSNLDGTEYTLENIAPDQIRFADIPKGSYTMTVTWEDGATNTLTVPLTVS